MQNRYWFQAAGLDFEDYQHSPVYRAHCATAKFMANIMRERGEQLNCWLPDNAASQFRMLRPFRSEGANALRNEVAARVKSTRRRLRMVRATLAKTTPVINDAYLEAHAEASRSLACGDIRAFSVVRDPSLGRVIHYETHQGWCPDPVYQDLHEECDVSQGEEVSACY